MYNSFFKSKIGILEIICDSENLLEVRFSSKIMKSNSNLTCGKVQEELERYLNGSLKEFKTPVKFTGTNFQNKVWEELIMVPYGAVITYQDLANRVGNPKGVRAVANAVGKNKMLIIVPCHRIIGTNKSLTGFSAGLENKVKLLELEGFKIKRKPELKKSLLEF